MLTSPSLSTLGAMTLSRVYGFKPQSIYKFIEEAGSIENLFRLDDNHRQSLKIGDDALEYSLKEWERMRALGARFISIEDEAYPQLLRECEDAPIGLYYRSDSEPEEFFSHPMISIVGTRDISPYGRLWCQNIVHALAQAPTKPSIVSGLALGVDGVAHESALRESLPTIAVLPTGIESYSPRSHYQLSEKCAHTPNCALISDFPIGYPITAANFLRRNRIIAGLSRATILIESKKHGGGLITARLASEYNRDVFVLPGRIDDIRSQGCNNLLEQELAEVIANLETLSSRLGLGRTYLSARGSFCERIENHYSNLPPVMLEDLLKVANCITEHRNDMMEEIAQRCSLTYSRVLSLCMMMQKDGFLQVDLLQRCHIIVKK